MQMNASNLIGQQSKQYPKPQSPSISILVSIHYPLNAVLFLPKTAKLNTVRCTLFDILPSFSKPRNLVLSLSKDLNLQPLNSSGKSPRGERSKINHLRRGGKKNLNIFEYFRIFSNVFERFQNKLARLVLSPIAQIPHFKALLLEILSHLRKTHLVFGC